MTELEQILNCLREANAEGMIVDTIWMDDDQTLFDFIELCIEEAALAQRQEAEPVVEVGEGQILQWAPPYKRYPEGTKFYLHPPKPAAQPETEASLVADALEAAKWEGVPIGNKCFIRSAIDHLRAAQPQVPEGHDNLRSEGGVMKFEESAVYKQGLVHRRLGELMTNPNTTIRDLADAKYEIGLDLEISLRQASFDDIEREQGGVI